MIDIIFAVIIILAVIKGLQKGLIIGLFSIIAFIVGLAAAIKLSAAVAKYIGNATTLSATWLPVISFTIVFLVVVILVHLGGKLIEKTFEMVALGWLNRIGGVFLYAILYTLIFSVFLFYAGQMKLFEKETIDASRTYSLIQPLGPKVINALGRLIPVFKDMFMQLEQFFDGVSNKL